MGGKKNLRSLGYTGEYRVMENGTDFQKGRAPEGLVAALREKHGLPPGLPGEQAAASRTTMPLVS